MDSTVDFEINNRIAVLTLNNPKQLNALTVKMRDEFLDHLLECERSQEVKVVILRGEGGHFCSGSSVKGMKNRTVVETLGHVKVMNEIIAKIHRMDKIVIAAIDGYAVGAGFSLALATDLIYASPEAKLGLAFNKIGLVPDCGLNYFLPRLVGAYKAKEWIFSGAIIPAEEAKTNGVINQIFSKEDLLTKVQEKAESLTKGPYYANAMTKSIINKSSQMKLEEVLEMEQFSQAILQQTDDHKEGVSAFRDKREPIFKER